MEMLKKFSKIGSRRFWNGIYSVIKYNVFDILQYDSS